MRILHPAIEKVAATLRKLLYKGQHGLPGTLAHSLGLLTILHHKGLPQAHIAGVLDGILILGHQILVTGHALDGNFHSFHHCKVLVIQIYEFYSF